MGGDRLIGASVEEQLDGVLLSLARGDLELIQVTPAIRGLVLLGHNAGFDAGCATAALRLQRLEQIADHWYLRATNSPEQVRAIIAARLESGSQDYWREWLDGRHDRPSPGDPSISLLTSREEAA